MIKKIAYISVFLLSLGLYAESAVVREIRIEGLWRTKEYVVLREITFSPGDTLTAEMEEESLIRLRNLRLFSEVEIGKEPRPDGGLTVTIGVTEKWTIIPIFKAGGGGGINYLTIGAYDINILGRYIELGAQYERLGSTNSGVFWFRDPRFLNQRLKLSGDFWYLSRNQRLYDDEADLFGGYTNQRNRAHLYMEREWIPGFLLGLGLDLTEDRYSEEDLESDVEDRNLSNGLTLPQGSTHLGIYLNTQFGQLNYNNHLVEGATVAVKTTYGLSLESREDDLVQAETILKGFHLLPRRFGNIGAQLTLAQSSSDYPHFQYYVGGLDAVRGYHHGQFLTPAYWKLNGEYRVESIKSEWFVLQHIFFADVGNLGDSLPAAIGNDDPLFVGYGAGLRFISPRVYRLNVRLDYGFTAGREGPGGLSFGFQHFF